MIPVVSDRIAASAESLTTVRTLEGELRELGLQPGSSVLVHASLSQAGWVCGGAVAVLQALMAVLGPAGTVVVPTHTAELSDPSGWRNPPVPQEWWATIRETMPPYEVATTPSLGMGALAELVRTWPGAVRSGHPQFSFAALGPAAEQLTAGHGLRDGLGEDSPLARLYDLAGWVLLLGVGHDSNTSLHLAEYRSGVRPAVEQAAPVLVDGHRQWVTWKDVDLYSEDFPALGTDLDATGLVKPGPVGRTVARLMRQPSVVDFAESWLPQHTARPLSQ
jgi:aminoglycoside 3-N-acetyltransferase